MLMGTLLCRWHNSHCLLLCVVLASLGLSPDTGRADRGTPWARHVIDDTSRGADGVRLMDVNGDGLMDIATGWEEGGAIRAYINPGPAQVTAPWPMVTVASVTDAEDAVFVDLDADGAMDVVTSAEGTTRGVFVSWAPSNPAEYLDPTRWRTEKIPSSAGWAWMFAVPMQVDGRAGIDIVAGAKWGGKIGWFESPTTNPRDLSQWSFHLMDGVGWTMSLIPCDMDDDGDLDIIVTDRYNDVGLQGTRWLQNPGTGTAAQKQPWPNQFIGAQGCEVMLSTLSDLDRDGLDDLIVPIRVPGSFSFFRRQLPPLPAWHEYSIAAPPNVGTPKAVNVGDINLDGKPDLVVSFANTPAGASGVVWMSYASLPIDPVWLDHEISGATGTKFDLVVLLDLDNDGDLDVITTEEQWGGPGLGVIWYENPAPIPGDLDRDGDVDQSDFGQLQACLTGPNVPQMLPACLAARLDGDDDIDGADITILQECLSGPNIPGDRTCAHPPGP
jgi:hypothetical protein